MTNGQDPMRVLVWTILAIVGVAVVLGAFGGWMWGWGWPWSGMMVAGPFIMLVPVLLVVLLVVALTDQDRRSPDRQEAPSGAGEPSALAVAKRRYANGEITRDEYLRIKQDLDGDGQR